LIDGVSLLSPLTGIGRYTYEVSKELERISNLNIDYFYGYYSKSLIDAISHRNIKAIKSIINRFPLLKRGARSVIEMSAELFAKRYSIYWQPNFIPSRRVKADRVITSVHDFSFIKYREYHPKERIEYFDNNFFQNIYKSDRIITGSNYTKGEILERLNFKEDDIRVIYHGINHSRFRIYEDLKLDLELPEKFILSVGTVEPRKNIVRLLRAYELLDRDIKEECSLLLVGFKGWENREIMDIVERNQKYIRYLGFLSDIDLAKVYNLATCFIYPSIYEGFGIPPLEAMACGTPVISSDSSSLPEVGGDAVLYCNPMEIEDIKLKIERLLGDIELQKRLISRGLERVKLFSWESSAREHLKLFREVI
jgi:glycosyltransferase involved in cell wall biosynthesis